MPTSFLDLPREIRDLIYYAVLLSPTGSIQPIPIPHTQTRAEKLPSSTTTTTTTPQTTTNPTTALTRFKLHIIDASLPEWKKQSSNPDPNQPSISLSLLRTCTQIHLETRSLFWLNNTFSFHSVSTMTEVLKIMGQIPSRLIERISFRLVLRDFAVLARALCLLESRARHGNFKSLRIDLFRWEFREIWSGNHRGKVYAYEAILESLRRDKGGCKFERRLNVVLSERDGCRLGRLGRLEGRGSFADETVKDLALASGGKVFANGVLVWEDYKQVGKIVRG